MAIEFIPVVLPADLAGVENGKLVPCQLKSVYFAGVGHLSLHPLAARSWDAMAAACFGATGEKLTTEGTYRPYEAQERVFRERYTDTYLPVRNVLTSQRQWQGKTWYLRRSKAPVAAPGRSNHGWGLAVDLAVFKGGKRLSVTSVGPVWDWLVGNAVSFGFSWEGARPNQAGWEPWHLRLVTGDNVPKRVLEVESYLGLK